MAETTAIGLILTMSKCMQKNGAPRRARAAAEDFSFGHIKVWRGFAFGQAGFPLSNGTKLMASDGQQHMLHPNWLQLFGPESVKVPVQSIVSDTPPAQ